MFPNNNNLSSKTSCVKYKNFFPKFTPVILYLSSDTANAGEYTQVNVYGNNFSLGSRIGYTIINFANTIIPVTYYGSTNISFIVPVNVCPGVYTVQAVNAFYPNSSYSNIVNFTIV